MATNIDKALYQQPQGIEVLALVEEPIENIARIHNQSLDGNVLAYLVVKNKD